MKLSWYLHWGKPCTQFFNCEFWKGDLTSLHPSLIDMFCLSSTVIWRFHCGWVVNDRNTDDCVVSAWLQWPGIGYRLWRSRSTQDIRGSHVICLRLTRVTFTADFIQLLRGALWRFCILVGVGLCSCWAADITLLPSVNKQSRYTQMYTAVRLSHQMRLTCMTAWINKSWIVIYSQLFRPNGCKE